MKKLLSMLVLLSPTLLFGQSAIEGTWHTNMDQSQLSQKPYVFSVHDGMYDCLTCSPKVNVKADGTDQSVTGQTYDTLSVTLKDPNTLHLVGKRDGKVQFEQTRTASADGKTLMLKDTFHPKDSDQTVLSEVMFERAAAAPSGAAAVSGSWRVKKLTEEDSGLTTTYKWAGDQLSMTQPTGQHYSAKVDGQDYPYQGSYSFNTVSLKRIDDQTIEETDKRDGKVILVSRITVAPDGKTLTAVTNNKLTDRTSTFVSEKQSFDAEK